MRTVVLIFCLATSIRQLYNPDLRLGWVMTLSVLLDLQGLSGLYMMTQILFECVCDGLFLLIFDGPLSWQLDPQLLGLFLLLHRLFLVIKHIEPNYILLWVWKTQLGICLPIGLQNFCVYHVIWIITILVILLPPNSSSCITRPKLLSRALHFRVYPVLPLEEPILWVKFPLES